MDKELTAFYFHYRPKGDAYERQWESLAGWFLGPRAENREVFNKLMLLSLNWHEDRREDFFPADPSYFTSEFRNSEAAQGEYADLEKKLRAMHDKLNKSIPFFSTRYQVIFFFSLKMNSVIGQYDTVWKSPHCAHSNILFISVFL